MSVVSDKHKIFVYKKKRFQTLGSAEYKMKSEDANHGKLRLNDIEKDNPDLIKYEYVIPKEPFINAGIDQTIICSDIAYLDSTITGVPLSSLQVEWVQVAGDPALIQNPNAPDTIATRNADDDTDKRYILRVTNLNTGIINLDDITVFATPTDFVYPEGGLFSDSDLDPLRNSSPSVFDVEQPQLDIPIEGYSKLNPLKLIRWALPEYHEHLIRVELYENIFGQWTLINSTNSPKQGYLTILNNRDIPAAYKIKFIYNFNGQRRSIDASNILYTEKGKSALAEEKAEISSQYYGFNTDLLRLSTIEYSYIDNAIVELVSNLFNFESEAQRLTATNYSLTEVAIVDLYSGQLNFLTDLMRTEKDQIGGG